MDKREKEVLDGQEHLVELRNSFREIEEKRAAAQGLSTRILETLKQIEAELAIYDGQTIAQREHVNKLKADLRSLEEGTKRLSGGTPSQEVPGRQRPLVRGRRGPPVPDRPQGRAASASSSWSTPRPACWPRTS